MYPNYYEKPKKSEKHKRQTFTENEKLLLEQLIAANSKIIENKRTDGVTLKRGNYTGLFLWGIRLYFGIIFSAPNDLLTYFFLIVQHRQCNKMYDGVFLIENLKKFFKVWQKNEIFNT